MKSTPRSDRDDDRPKPGRLTAAHPNIHHSLTRSPIHLEDEPLFRAAFSSLREPISDTTFAICLGWCAALDLSYAVIEEHLCLFSAADGDLSMMLPPMALTRTADERLAACVERCFAIMDEANASIGLEHSRIEYVDDEMLMRLQQAVPMMLSATPMPGDYIYPRQAMVELAGGDLKGKRKMRNRFERENPEITFGPITDADLGECRELLKRWRTTADQRHEGEANERLIGTDVLRKRDEGFTLCLLEHMHTLKLESMLVRSGGRLVAFTLGERLTPDQAVIYVEKTDPEVDGAPQFIFSKFCEVNFPDVSEINVGDDWGIESLRYTKTSYRPSRMIAKTMLSRDPIPQVQGVEHNMLRSLRKVELDPNAPVLSPKGPISLRRAARADAIDIVEIEASAFIEEDRFSVRQIRRLIDNPRAIVLVAEERVNDQPTIRGWIVALVRNHRRWQSGRIYGVAVAHPAKGKGIGRALVQSVIEQLQEAGISRVYLEVRADNTPAMTLYESLGFEAIALLADYYADDIHGIRMRRVAQPHANGG
jgi:ribosomal protein S18 acetylase RimI-like enzyme